MTVATIEAVSQADGVQVRLSGDWTLVTLPPPISGLELRLRDLAAGNAYWDLQAIERMDSAGAILLWRAWGRQWPASLAVSRAHRSLLERVEAIRADVEPERPSASWAWIRLLGDGMLAAIDHLAAMLALIGQMLLDVAHLCVHPGDIPWREFSANLYKSGAQALPVTALIGFLIGIVLSYLSALQLSDLWRRRLHRQPAGHQHCPRTRSGAGRGAGRRTFGVGDDRPDRRHAGDRRNRRAGHDGRFA
jgi:phospholipid/cholesterol/gamma-HCH transport system permease protein